MYICEGSGLMQYETFDELLNAELNGITEDKDNYYVDVHYDNQYNDTMWVVNKKTQEVSQISFIDYMFDVEKNTTPVNPETLKRVS